MKGLKTMNHQTVIEKLAEIYPQLYLDPDRETKEAYRRIVLEGEQPEVRDLSHFEQSSQDSEESVDTPAGIVQVISLRARKDYERFVRCMLAAREGPDRIIPASQGASTLVAFNWPRIYAHRERFLKEQLALGVTEPDWSSEFARFTSVKENYQDLLVVLSWGPYSGVMAAEVGQSEENWTELSYVIRKYHELTHVICRRLYPERIEAVWDELVADAVGIYAALGRFDPVLEKRFLGIADDRYTGGRLENYTAQAAILAPQIAVTLEQFRDVIFEHSGATPFDLIPLLQEYQTGFHALYG